MQKIQFGPYAIWTILSALFGASFVFFFPTHPFLINLIPGMFFSYGLIKMLEKHGSIGDMQNKKIFSMILAGVGFSIAAGLSQDWVQTGPLFTVIAPMIACAAGSFLLLISLALFLKIKILDFVGLTLLGGIIGGSLYIVTTIIAIKISLGSFLGVIALIFASIFIWQFLAFREVTKLLGKQTVNENN